MNPVTKIAKNTIVIFISRLIEAGAGFFIMMVLCRYLKPALYGDFAFVTAVILAFQPVINMELNTILIREISRNPEKEGLLLGSALFLKLMLSLAFILGLVVLGTVMDFSFGLKMALYVAGAAEVFQQLFWLYAAIFMAHEQMEYETLTTMLYRLITVGGIVVLAAMSWGKGVSSSSLIAVFSVLMTGHFVRLILGIFITRKRFHVKRIQVSFNMIKILLHQSWVLGIAAFFTGLSLRLDVYILKAYRGSVEVSMFHLPHMIVLQLQIFAVALVLALFPTFSRLGGDGAPESQFKDIREKSMRSLTFVGLVFSTTLILFAEPIIRIMGGHSFLQSTIPLQILAWCVPILFIHYLAASLLTSLKFQNLLIVGASVSLILNLILDLLWVPSYGAQGAAWGTVCAYACQMVIILFFVIRREKENLSILSVIGIPTMISIACVYIASYISTWSFVSILERFGLLILVITLIFIFQPKDLKQFLIEKMMNKIKRRTEPRQSNI